MGNPFSMNLQLFGEGDPAPADPTPEGAPPSPAPGGEEQRFTQAEVDAMIAAKLQEYQSGESQRIQNARSEAERLAQMTESERAEHKQRQAEEDLRAREAEIARRESAVIRRELKAQALETLAGKGLDKSLADLLDYGSAESCSASIERMEKAFRAAVQAGVEQRLKTGGGALPRGGEVSQPQNTPDETMALRLAKANAETDRAANDIITRYM